jgi:hypothetical protein
MSRPKLTKQSVNAIIEKLKSRMYRFVAYRRKIYTVRPDMSMKITTNKLGIAHH